MSDMSKKITNIRIKFGKHPDRYLPPVDIYAMFSHIDTLTERVKVLEGERAVDTEMLNRYIDRCKYYESQLAAYENDKYNNWTVGNLRNELARQAERRMRIVSISERMLRGESIWMPQEISLFEAYDQSMSNEGHSPFTVWVFRISKEEE